VAATGDANRAEASWRALMSDMAFDDVNLNTQRLMPAIFQNLRDTQDLPERDRMRGAFKHAWSKNMGMIHSIKPVLADFAAEGMDYRVLKGAAIQGLCGTVGSRTMGDVDVLVSATDSQRAAGILLRHGFRRNTFSVCDGHSDVGHHDALNFNKGDTHVDLHVAEFKNPVLLLTTIMSKPPVLARVAGIEMAVPPAELLILHAATHGCLASGPTDFVQAVVDVSALSERAQPRVLETEARVTGTVLPLMEIADEIGRIGARPLPIAIRTVDVLRARVKNGLKRTSTVVAESNSVFRRIRTRKRGDNALQEVATDFRGSRRSYGAWLRLGQFALFERGVVRASCGFLDEPKGTWSSGATVQPFIDDEVPGLSASNVSSRALDWRFQVVFPEPQAKVRLVLNSPTLDSLDAFVFCNGVPVTRVVAGDPSTRDIVMRGLGRRNEFSLRALWTVCTECYRGLDDLSIRIDLGSDV
jgi:hypothetical protein